MEMSMKQSIKNLEERTEPITIIHTKTFYCDGSEDEYDQHPRVHYTFNNRVDSTDEKMFERRGYVVCEYCYRKFKYEPEKLAQKEERTHSEEMQDKLEPIDDYVNKILKGSG